MWLVICHELRKARSGRNETRAGVTGIKWGWRGRNERVQEERKKGRAGEAGRKEGLGWEQVLCILLLSLFMVCVRIERCRQMVG